MIVGYAIAADIQRRRASPFVKPSDVVKAALRIAAEKIVADGMRVTQGAAQ